MEINLHVLELFNVFVLSLLSTLMVYHIFIYLGRKGKGHSYYLNFSLFAFFLLVFVLFAVDLRWHFFDSQAAEEYWVPFIEGVSFVGFVHFMHQLLADIFQLPRQKKKFFYPMYFTFGIMLFCQSTNFFLPYSIFEKYFMPIILLGGGGSAFYMLGVYIYWLIQSRQLRVPRNLIILASFLLFWIELFAEQALFLFQVDYPLKGTYFFIGATVFIWAYILARKFNLEFLELSQLKAKLEEKVLERTQELNEANERRTQTFINLAHETRTPLTLIQNYLDKYIAKTGQDADIEVVKENIDRLLEDILTFFNEEKLQRGLNLYNHDQTSNFSRILSSRISLFSSYAKERNLQFSTNIRENIYLNADPVALDRLINNLIENAVKYTPNDGFVAVRLMLEGDKVIFSVEDSGKGIPKNLQKQVFEPYFQASKENLSLQGMGMGLSIVKNIVADLDGDISLESNEGTGTHILITFKAASGQQEVLHTERILDSKSSLINKTKLEDSILPEASASIMIVEDNYDMLRYLYDSLKEQYSIYPAVNGAEALSKLPFIPKPDLIISDIMMDEMDGFKFLEDLSSKEEYAHIPLIFLTAKSTVQDKMQGLKLGAIDYIHKPFHINELLEKISSYIEKIDSQRQIFFKSAYKAILKEMQSPTMGSYELNKFDENAEAYSITKREKEIIALVAQGYTHKSIGKKLFISDKTVSKHIQNIYDKLQVNSKEAMLKYMYN